MAFKIEKVSKGTSKSTPSDSDLSKLLKTEIALFGKPYSNKQKEDLYTELGVLLKAGITLKEALALIKGSQKKEKHRLLFDSILTDLIDGKSFSDTLANRKEFSEYEYYSLNIGEETGTLDKVADQLGDFFLRKNEQRRNLISALSYPAIIFITATIVVIFMLRFVVPMFQDIFRQNNVDLPWITELIIAVSDFLGSYGWMLLLGLVGVFLLRRLFTKKKWYKRLINRLTLKTPILGGFVKTVYLAQFTQAVSLLTASKVPVVNSIQLVKKMIDFVPLQEALETVEQRLLRGSSLSDSLKGNLMFDNKMVALVKVAEETNQTEFIFDRLNLQYATEVQQRSKLLSTVMEPLIIVFVGIMVGVILIAMYLPMFKLSSVLG